MRWASYSPVVAYFVMMLPLLKSFSRISVVNPSRFVGYVFGSVHCHHATKSGRIIADQVADRQSDSSQQQQRAKSTTTTPTAATTAAAQPPLCPNTNAVEAGHVYLVATPLGNINDITFRAKEILTYVDYICAEDTRNTINLLRHLSIPHKKLISHHEHNLKQVNHIPYIPYITPLYTLYTL